MDTEQIIWTVVIVVAALVLIGLVVATMRKKSQADKRSRAQDLREEAVGGAAGLPDARARAEQAAVQAEHKRHEAERAEEEARAARTEVDQQQARHEDQVRAADRLDPDVNHKAKDYSPDVAQPVGPSSVPTDPAYADPETGRATGATGTTRATDATDATPSPSSTSVGGPVGSAGPVGPAAAAGAASGATSTTSTSTDAGVGTSATGDPGADAGGTTAEQTGVASHDDTHSDDTRTEDTRTNDARTDGEGSHVRAEDPATPTTPTDPSGHADPDSGGTHRA